MDIRVEKSGVHTKFIPDYNKIIPTKPYTEDFGAIHRFIKVDDVLEPDMEHHKRYNELKQYFDECYTGLLKTYENLAQWK